MTASAPHALSGPVARAQRMVAAATGSLEGVGVLVAPPPLSSGHAAGPPSAATPLPVCLRLFASSGAADPPRRPRRARRGGRAARAAAAADLQLAACRLPVGA